ncbi:15027_t:CDS:1, partial [Gigaspora margarita]
PYTTNCRYNKIKQLESSKGHNLRNRNKNNIAIEKIEKEIPMEILEDHIIAQPKIKKSRTKHQLSIIDQLELYDILTDLLTSRVNVTYSQMLRYSDQEQKLAKILKRPIAPVKSNLVKAVTNKRTIATKCHIRIKGNPITAV